MASPEDAEESARVIQVVIAGLSGVLLQLVVQLIAQQPDMVLVQQVDNLFDLLGAISPTVDLLILGAAQVAPPPGICSHLLIEFPNLKILVLATTGQAAMLYWLGLRRRRLAPVSTGALLNTIRQAYHLNPAV